MNILIYQVSIFLILIISSYLGKRALIITFILVSLFTIAEVRTSPLMILQFITIFLSAGYGYSKIEDREIQREIEKENRKRYKPQYERTVYIKPEPIIVTPRYIIKTIIGVICCLILIGFILFCIYKLVMYMVSEDLPAFIIIAWLLVFGWIPYFIIKSVISEIKNSIKPIFEKKKPIIKRTPIHGDRGFNKKF